MEIFQYELIELKKDYLDSIKEKEYTIVKTTDSWQNYNVFKLKSKGCTIFKYLGNSTSELKCWAFQEGIFYKHKWILGYYKGKLHLQRKISNIINIFHTIDNIYFLEGKNIFRFKYKQNWNHKGLFKLPTEKVLEISNLYDTFSEEQLSKSFLFSKIDKVFVIINFF